MMRFNSQLMSYGKLIISIDQCQQPSTYDHSCRTICNCLHVGLLLAAKRQNIKTVNKSKYVKAYYSTLDARHVSACLPFCYTKYITTALHSITVIEHIFPDRRPTEDEIFHLQNVRWCLILIHTRPHESKIWSRLSAFECKFERTMQILNFN